MGVGVTLMELVVLGLAIVAWADADVVLSACEIAMIVTVDGVGTVAGAVNKPVVEIVPTVELPPDTPLTSQFTFVLLVPVTVAVNCCRAFTTTVAELGATVTKID